MQHGQERSHTQNIKEFLKISKTELDNPVENAQEISTVISQNIPMGNKSINKHSTSLVINKMQIKAKIPPQILPKMAKIRKMNRTKC